MSASVPVNASALTDDEVIQQFCQGQLDQARFEALFVEARDEAADQLRAEGKLSQADQARLVQRIDELQRAWFVHMKELILQAARKYFTIEELRAMVQLQLDHPNLHARTAEFGIQFGPIFMSEVMGLKTALDEATEEVANSIRVQYDA